MRFLSLFSGGGLGDYGLELAGMTCVGQVEIDEYCQKILKLRWPDVPKWRDIRDVTGKEILERCGTINLISGGFPCQPFSVAGQQRGKSDNRFLWPEMLRVISEVKPSFVLGENVSGIIKLALDDVLNDLEGIGYETATIVFPAHAIGAPHRRERVWIVGYTKHDGSLDSKIRGSMHESQEPEKQIQSLKSSGASCLPKDVADTFEYEERGAQKQGEDRDEYGIKHNRNEMGNDFGNSSGFWSVEPSVGRVAHGVANRVDRLKLLGNGQVVQVVEWIGSRIMEHNTKKAVEHGI